MRGAIVLLAGLALAAAGPVVAHVYPAGRFPMWLAPFLYRAHGHGTTVLVHL